MRYWLSPVVKDDARTKTDSVIVLDYDAQSIILNK